MDAQKALQAAWKLGTLPVLTEEAECIFPHPPLFFCEISYTSYTAMAKYCRYWHFRV